MNKYRIAIEEGLSNIEEILRKEGYDVRELDDGGAQADAVIITGMNDDLAGYANVLTDGIVIDASGRQPEEILYELEKHLRIRDEL